VKGKRPVGVMLEDTWLLRFVYQFEIHPGKTMMLEKESQFLSLNRNLWPLPLSPAKARQHNCKFHSSGSGESVRPTPMRHLYVQARLWHCGFVALAP